MVFGNRLLEVQLKSSYQLAQLSQIKYKADKHVINCLPQLLPKYTTFIRSLWT